MSNRPGSINAIFWPEIISKFDRFAEGFEPVNNECLALAWYFYPGLPLPLKQPECTPVICLEWA